MCVCTPVVLTLCRCLLCRTELSVCVYARCSHTVPAALNDLSALQTDSSSSDTEVGITSEGCRASRLQRRHKQKVFRAKKVDHSVTFRTLDELLYNDNLPEVGMATMSVSCDLRSRRHFLLVFSLL